MKNIITVFILFFALSVSAQKTQDTIFVDGLCGMCKDRIESSLDVKGIWFAEWSVETKELFVVYKEKKISREEIGAILNEAGHDNEISKATQAQYEGVHGCCLYRDEEVIKAHENHNENSEPHE